MNFGQVVELFVVGSKERFVEVKLDAIEEISRRESNSMQTTDADAE